jgi:tyrosine-specific transport protein
MKPPRPLLLLLLHNHYSFALLLGIGASGIHGELLAHQDWTVVAKAAPVMLVALVFHNVVPVITTQLEGNVAKIRLASAAIVTRSITLLAHIIQYATVLLAYVMSRCA